MGTPTNTAALEAEIEDLRIRLAGKQVERCYALGDVPAALAHQSRMFKLCRGRLARLALIDGPDAGGCFFVNAGEAARAATQGMRQGA